MSVVLSRVELFSKGFKSFCPPIARLVSKRDIGGWTVDIGLLMVDYNG